MLKSKGFLVKIETGRACFGVTVQSNTVSGSKGRQ